MKERRYQIWMVFPINTSTATPKYATGIPMSMTGKCTIMNIPMKPTPTSMNMIITMARSRNTAICTMSISIAIE